MGISAYAQKLRAKLGTDLILAPAVCAIILNDAGEILLARRADNGRWALIGGMMDPGEQPAAAVVREALEETGVTVRPEKITGVYLTRHIVYPDGNQAQYVVTTFQCRAISGTPHVADDESLEVRYFALDQMPELSFDHGMRVKHALSGNAPFFEVPQP